MALTCGWFTSAMPTSTEPPCTNENTPFGMLVFSAALLMAIVTNSQVPGCEGCPFTMTGHPAASAEAVSPPATENANGKLLAPKTPTTPNGFCMYLKSDLGKGCLSGIAVSMRASIQEPSLKTVANNCS